MRLGGNTVGKNDAKNCHLRTITRICRAVSSQLRHVSTIGKKVVKQQYLATCPHNMANFGPLTAEIGSEVWGTPANFNWFRVLAALLQRRHYVYVLRSPMLAALRHGSPAAGISQTLRRVTRNGITKLLQRSPPIFGWAAITLGIGPHSSLACNTQIVYH